MAKLFSSLRSKKAPAVQHRLEEGSVRIYAIGDIHGRLDLLHKLIQAIHKDSQAAPYQLVFLGDYIDRGPDSSQVVQYLLNLQQKMPNCIFLKGNHEEALQDFIADPEHADQWIDWGGAEAMESYGVLNPCHRDPIILRDELLTKMPEAHFHFFQNLPSIWRNGDYVFVHAGLHPDWSLEEQQDSAMLWIRDKFFREGVNKWPDLCIVHGHTPVDKGEDHGWRVNVDTGGVWSGKMAACVIPSFAEGEAGDKRRILMV